MGYTTISVTDTTAERFHNKKEIIADDTDTSLGSDRFLELLLEHWEDGDSWIGEPNVVMLDEVDTNLEAIEERVDSIDRKLKTLGRE